MERCEAAPRDKTRAPFMNALDLIARAQGLLVDLDGTLVDSAAPVGRVWAAFAHRHGLDPDEVLRFAQGRPSRETIGQLLPEGEQAAEAAAVEEAEVNDPAGIRALPGAADLLAGPWRLAIVTSCSQALASARLRAAGLPTPPVLVSSDELERGKPDPACFLLGARRLGLEPIGCVVIEDAPAGISAGLAAGAKVIALRTTHPDHDLRDAHAIIDDLAAIT
ncbi:MAG: HAD-IA family hydrolase [Actinomycetota bacterium]|nr:HAD-IA family hydrolase [Actinomycetota bacterium]